MEFRFPGSDESFTLSNIKPTRQGAYWCKDHSSPLPRLVHVMLRRDKLVVCLNEETGKLVPIDTLSDRYLWSDSLIAAKEIVYAFSEGHRAASLGWPKELHHLRTAGYEYDFSYSRAKKTAERSYAVN